MLDNQYVGRPRPIMVVSQWQRVQEITRQHPEIADSVFTYRHLIDGSLTGMGFDGIWIDDVEEYILHTARAHYVRGFSMSTIGPKEWDS